MLILTIGCKVTLIPKTLKYNGEKHREAILSRLADQAFKENFGDDNNGKK